MNINKLCDPKRPRRKPVSSTNNKWETWTSPNLLATNNNINIVLLYKEKSNELQAVWAEGKISSRTPNLQSVLKNGKGFWVNLLPHLVAQTRF